MDRINDVLDRIFAEILEDDIQLVANAGMDDVGNKNTASLAEAFETCRDIDAVTVDILAVDDDVAQIHPDPQFHAAVFTEIPVACPEWRRNDVGPPVELAERSQAEFDAVKDEIAEKFRTRESAKT